ncbi:MAG: hypothetical protein K940chlam1_01330, partial [Candidatus Anoxychlamydiales bacterium]|nr:hypothetical protein [Candidatus Anoxychlamydiales bacterium]
ITKSIQSLLTGDGNTELNDNSLTINQTVAAQTYAGIISGTGGIEKAGGNNLIFQAASAHLYFGDTTISDGFLILNSPGSSIAASSSVSLTSGSATLTVPLGIGDKAIKTLSGSGSVALNGNDLTITQNSPGILSGTIGGASSSIIKEGSGQLTFSGANGYSGSTTINEGSIELSLASGSISASSQVTINAGSLDIEANAGAKSINILNGLAPSNINLNNNVLTIDQGVTAGIYSGVITSSNSSGGIIKQGVADLTLGGTNTYTGPTTITGDSLTLPQTAASSIASSSSVSIAAVGSLILATGGAGPLTKTIQDLGGAVGSTISMNDNTLAITQNSASIFAGIISGTGGIIKQGTNNLTFTNTNNYSGPTAINTGTLTLGTSGTIASSSNVVVNGTLTNDQANTKNINNLSGSGGIVLNKSASTFAITQTSPGTFSGIISDSFSDGVITLGSSSTSTLTLSGSNAYGGGTNINAGTLSVSSANNLSTGTITLEDGTLQTTETMTIANAFTLTSSVTNTKTLEVPSGKTTTLSGTVTSAIPAAEIFSKTGSGTLSIESNDSGNTGTTNITAGTIIMKPSSRWSASNFNISSGATIKGTGTIEAAVTNNGIFSPGESIGITPIVGSYTENGTLEIEITSTPNDSDRVVVSGAPGTAFLNPATSILSVIPLSSSEFFQEGTEYVIITATGGIVP